MQPTLSWRVLITRNRRHRDDTDASTGDRAGDEIIQLYVRDRVGSVTRPVRELKGFQRVSLDPGEEKLVRFEIPVQQLGFHDLATEYTVEPGDFTVWVGANATGGLKGMFAVVG